MFAPAKQRYIQLALHLENYLHAEVCAGRMPLGIAQREVARDWVAAYRKNLGEPSLLQIR